MVRPAVDKRRLLIGSLLSGAGSLLGLLFVLRFVPATETGGGSRMDAPLILALLVGIGLVPGALWSTRAVTYSRAVYLRQALIALLGAMFFSLGVQILGSFTSTSGMSTLEGTIGTLVFFTAPAFVVALVLLRLTPILRRE